MSILKPTAGLALGLALALMACRPAGAQDNTAPEATPVTFEEVVKLLRTGKSEKEILDTLGRSPIDVNFILGESQVDELRKMRVTDEFLTELRNLGTKKPALTAGDVTDLVLILDCSGSMTDRTKDGAVKMDAAKQAVTDLIRDFPAGRRLAFIVYGHDKTRACQAVDVVRPLGPLGALAKDDLLRYIVKLQPVGHTPIARALETAAGELVKAKGLSKVVLITDGIETCHGDPVKAAAALVEKAKADVDVIGFVLKPEEGQALDRIAKAGRGKYYDAQTVENLRKDLQQVAQAPVQPKKPVEPVVVKKEEPPAALSPAEKALVESLTDKGEHYENMLVRKQAADSLRERKAMATAPFLAKRVADDIWYGTGEDSSKDAALAALLEVAPDRVQEALVAATKAKNARVRAWAARRLADPEKAGERKTRTSTPPRTSRAPNSPSKGPSKGLPKVPDTAAAALSPVEKALVESLADEGAQYENMLVRKQAADSLRERKATAAAPFLARRVADDVWYGTGDDTSKDAALAALREVAPDRVQEALVAATKAKNARVKAWAARMLATKDN